MSGRIRGFADLRVLLQESATDTSIPVGELRENLAALLEAPRPLWSKQLWRTALIDEGWRPWTSKEASVEHPDDTVRGWTEGFARTANLSGPDAYRVALLWNVDFTSFLMQDSAEFSHTDFNAEVLRYYLLERRSRIVCQCWLLHLLSRPGVCGDMKQLKEAKDKIHSMRAKIISTLTSDEPLEILSIPGERPDLFRDERGHQRICEFTALLQLLIVMNHDNPLPAAQRLAELQRVLGSSKPESVFHMVQQTKGGVVHESAAARLRSTLCVWILGCLAADGKGKEALPEGITSPLMQLEETEAALFDFTMWCRDPQSAPFPVTHQMVSGALAMLKGILSAPHAASSTDTNTPQLPVRGMVHTPETAYLDAPVAAIVREWLKAMHSAYPPALLSAPQLLELTRVMVAVTGGRPFEMSPSEGDAQPSLVQDLLHLVGWLFPACLPATTSLFELVASTTAENLDEWWSCLSVLDKSALEYPFMSDASTGHEEGRQASMITELPPSAMLCDVVALAAPEGCPRGKVPPAAFGNWDAPLAPLPSQKAIEEAERVMSSKLEQLDPQSLRQRQLFAIWRLPEEHAINGWTWMCVRCIHLLKLGGRVEGHDQWLQPYLELVISIVRLFHAMVCGPDRKSEYEYFCSVGATRLAGIEANIRNLQRFLTGGTDVPWSLAMICSDLAANMVEWQEARCYSQRARLVRTCSALICSLLDFEAKAAGGGPLPPEGTAAEAVISSLHSLFIPGHHNSRSPLLHLFWVVEAANKRCTCTLGVMQILQNILSVPDNYMHVTDLREITSYMCEVFTDLCNQWVHLDGEQWDLTTCCLQTLVQVSNKTRIQRTFANGTKSTQVPVISHLLQSTRMGRSLLDIIGRSCVSILDREYNVEKYSDAMAARKGLSLALQLLEDGLLACRDRLEQGASAPPLVQLVAKTEAAYLLHGGQQYTVPALLFHMVHHGTDENDVRTGASKVFGLMCTVTPVGTMLRHIGHHAPVTGPRILQDLEPRRLGCAWVETECDSDDPDVVEAFEHGRHHPFDDDHAVPERFRRNKQQTLAWKDGLKNSCRLLAMLKMLGQILRSQPQLFMQAFLAKDVEVDPLGSLLRSYVGIKGDYCGDSRPFIKEAVLDLFEAALQAREPCRSIILSRTVPTMMVRITANGPGLGDRLALQKATKWHAMPKLLQEDLAELRDELSSAYGAPVDCVQYDRMRSWPHCGFSRRGQDIVDGPLSIVVAPISSQPSPDKQEKILERCAKIAERSFKSIGIENVSIKASWYTGKPNRPEESWSKRPIRDPEVWAILAESLAYERFQLGAWLHDTTSEKSKRSGEVAYSASCMAHVLRTMSGLCCVAHLMYPESRFLDGKDVDPQDYETAIHVKAARLCLEQVLGKWGELDADKRAAGVLGMLVPTLEGGGGSMIEIDGILGMAAGFFHGSVAVSTHSMRTPNTPKRRLQPDTLRTTPSSPRKTIMSAGSPHVISPLMRPAFAATPATTPAPQPSPASQYPSTPVELQPLAMPPPPPQPVDDDRLEQLTIYELLKRSEALLKNTLASTTVVDELAPAYLEHLAADQEGAALAVLREGVSVPKAVPATAASILKGAFVDSFTLRQVYPQHTDLAEVSDELNNAVGLAASVLYLLKAATTLVRILLQRPCPENGKGRRILPTKALVNPSDWRYTPGKSCSLVYVILERCLLHPPQTSSSGGYEVEPSRLVSCLDLMVRSEACQLLSEMVVEVMIRRDLVREGRLDPKEKPFVTSQDRHTAQRHIAWQVFSVYKAMLCTTEDHFIAGYSRKGKCQPGEADLLLTLCKLADTWGGTMADMVLSKTELSGDTSVMAEAIFPYLHQYLAIDTLEQTDPADLECQKAALIALNTFGMPIGGEVHGAQVCRTLLSHIHRLHTVFQEECTRTMTPVPLVLSTESAGGSTGGGSVIQSIVDRALLFLRALGSIASSPSGAQVFSKERVLALLCQLTAFMPPAHDAVPAPPQGTVAMAPPGSPKLAIPAWCVTWQAILDVVAAAATAPPITGKKNTLPAEFMEQAVIFANGIAERVKWLLGKPGLQGDVGEEALRCLQILSCICRARLASGPPLSVTNPITPWLIPCLQSAMDPLKEAVVSVCTSFTPLDPSADAAGGESQPSHSKQDFKRASLLFDAAAQIFSIMRMHLISFLPIAAPVGSLRKASQPVRDLLQVLDLASEEKDDASFTMRINKAATIAVREAPEPGLMQAMKAFHWKDPEKDGEVGSFLDRLSRDTARRLRDTIIAECSSCWSPAAGATASELLTFSPTLMGNAVSECSRIAVFGLEDLTNPAKGLSDVTERIAEQLAVLLELPLQDGGKKRQGTRIASAAKAAACAVEQAAVLRQVYLACLELAVPERSQYLWAWNVLQGLLHEKTSTQLTNIPGNVLKKRLSNPLAQLSQSGKHDELAKVQVALALHCLEELRRHPESTPWLSASCARLQSAAAKAAARGDTQGNRLGKLADSTIRLLRQLSQSKVSTQLITQ